MTDDDSEFHPLWLLSRMFQNKLLLLAEVEILLFNSKVTEEGHFNFSFFL